MRSYLVVTSYSNENERFSSYFMRIKNKKDIKIYFQKYDYENLIFS